MFNVGDIVECKNDITTKNGFKFCYIQGTICKILDIDFNTLTFLAFGSKIQLTYTGNLEKSNKLFNIIKHNIIFSNEDINLLQEKYYNFNYIKRDLFGDIFLYKNKLDENNFIKLNENENKFPYLPWGMIKPINFKVYLKKF